MSNKTARLGVFVLLLAMVAALVPVTSFAQAQGSDAYYWYQGQKLSLNVSPLWVGVRYRTDDPSLQNRIFQQTAPLIDTTASPKTYTNPDVTLLPLPKNATIQTALNTVGALRAQAANFEWVGRVFDYEGTLAIETPEFVAQFPATMSRAQIDALNAQYGVSLLQTQLSNDNTFVLEAPITPTSNAFTLANLYHESGFALYAEPNLINILHIDYTPNDTYYTTSWHLNNTGQITGSTVDADIDAPEAWDITRGSSSVILAVVDDGVEITHEDLAANVVAGYDFVQNDNDPTPQQSWQAHGTNVAGLMAAVGNNGKGVSGVCPQCRIMPIRLADTDQNGSFSLSWTTAANAVNWAATNGAWVLNNSWGGGTANTTFDNALANVTTTGRGGSGSLIFFSAGNSNASTVSYPASNVNVISVAASNLCDGRKQPVFDNCNFNEYWWGSNYGSGLDVSSPGVRLYSTDRNGSLGYDSSDYFSSFNGTSGASPVAAGVMGLIFSANTGLSGAQARSILESTADDVNGGGYDTTMGWGRVNAFRAVQAAAPSRPDTIGVYRPSGSRFLLRNQNTTGPADIDVVMGAGATDVPVVGDWNNDGIDTVGVYRRTTAQFFLKDTNTTGAPVVYSFTFGNANDLPMAGDWNNNGGDGIGVYRSTNGILYVRNTLNTGFADYSMVFGIANDLPVAGDWNGDGQDSPGIFRPSQARFYLTNQVINGIPTANYQFAFGTSADVPVAGDWDSNGTSGIGVFRPTNGVTYLRNTLSTGFADIAFVYGTNGDRPVAGKWTSTSAPQLAPEFDPNK